MDRQTDRPLALKYARPRNTSRHAEGVTSAAPVASDLASRSRLCSATKIASGTMKSVKPTKTRDVRLMSCGADAAATRSSGPHTPSQRNFLPVQTPVKSPKFQGMDPRLSDGAFRN